MEIYVKDLAKIITLTMAPSATIHDVKEQIKEKEGVEPDMQRLIYAGKQLADDRTLSDYGIQNGKTIHMVVRSYGK